MHKILLKKYIDNLECVAYVLPKYQNNLNPSLGNIKQYNLTFKLFIHVFSKSIME